MKILEEDTKTAKEEYERVVSELWFALKKWAEFGFLFLSPAAVSEALVQELSGRRYQVGKLTRVESKDDYKSRGNGSPNKADAVTLLLHLVRVAFRITPSALDDLAGDSVTGNRFDRGAVPVYVDSTNALDSIEDEPEERNWMD